MDFADKKCVPCGGGVDPLPPEKVKEYLDAVPNWQTDSVNKKIYRNLVFKDFVSAIAFINALAQLAESEGHHPNFTLRGWNKLNLEFYTHAIQGLFDNDFVMAAKTNLILGAHPEWLKT